MVKRPGPKFTGISDVLDIDYDDGNIEITVICWARNKERAESRAALEANANQGILYFLNGDSFEASECKELNIQKKYVINGYEVVIQKGGDIDNRQLPNLRDILPR